MGLQVLQFLIEAGLARRCLTSPGIHARAAGASAHPLRFAQGDTFARPPHTRISTAPQCRPAPRAAKATRAPSGALPACRASWKASGRVAEVVLPYFWMLL